MRALKDALLMVAMMSVFPVLAILDLIHIFKGGK